MLNIFLLTIVMLNGWAAAPATNDTYRCYSCKLLGRRDVRSCNYRYCKEEDCYIVLVGRDGYQYTLADCMMAEYDCPELRFFLEALGYKYFQCRSCHEDLCNGAQRFLGTGVAVLLWAAAVRLWLV